jgi:lipoprotein-anchoring transpeptidase ErfK/SrfK
LVNPSDSAETTHEGKAFWSRRTTVQTIKTAVVVVLLLVVLYGAYIAINGSDTELPPELQNMLANESEMNIDVSMPSFDSAGMTSSDGNSGIPFGNSSSAKSESPFPMPPASVFNSSKSSTNAPPQTLAPPKLASIPSFPPMPETPSSLGNPTQAETSPENKDAGKITTDSEAPPFSLNPDRAAKSHEEKSSAIQPLVPPSSVASSQKPFDGSSSSAIPSKVASQTTLSNDGSLGPASTENTSTETGEPDKNAVASSETKANITGRSFENAKRAAIEQVDRGEFKEALANMSAFYNSPELTAEQNLDLINLLDTLAGETIYSRRHLLDTPYVVGPNESLEGIANRYEVPSELLAKINAVDPTMGLLPGTKLKVFRGPFRAEVDVNRHEMTVFLGNLYAGRFPVSTGSDPQPKEGVFQVRDKQRHRNYYGKGGIQIDGNDPRNPYGGWWMDLGHELSIHGSPDNPANENANLGCISLSPLDASDVFAMLSRGSQVTIKR